GLSVCSDPAHGGDGIPGGYECGHGSSCSRICAEDSALALREVLPRDEDQLCCERGVRCFASGRVSHGGAYESALLCLIASDSRRFSPGVFDAISCSAQS